MVGQVSAQLSNSEHSTLPAVYRQSGYSLPSLVREHGNSSNAWPVNPYSFRSLIRSCILNYLHGIPQFSNLEEKSLRNIVDSFDEILLKKSSSQEDYMDMNTLAPRVNELINHFGRGFHYETGAAPISSSMFTGTLPRSELYAAAPSTGRYTACPGINSTKMSYAKCSFLPNNEQFASSILYDGLSTSNGHFPDEHLNELDNSHSIYKQNHNLSSQDPMELDDGPPMSTISTCLPEFSFSDREMLISTGGCQTGQDDISSNLGTDLIPIISQSPSFDAFPNTRHNEGYMVGNAAISKGDMSLIADAKFYASQNLNVSTTLPGFVGNCNQLNPCNSSTLSMNCQHGSFESNLIASQQAHQFAPHMHQQILGQQQSFTESNMFYMEKKETEDQSIWNKNINISSDLLQHAPQVSRCSQQIRRQDVAHRLQPALQTSINDQTFSSESSPVGHVSKSMTSKSVSTRGNCQYKANLLLLFNHAWTCSNPKKECPIKKCPQMKWMLEHMSHCDGRCQIECYKYQQLLSHYKNCCSSTCLICVPVRNILRKSQPCNSGSEILETSTLRLPNDGDTGLNITNPATPSSVLTDQVPPAKRLKMELQSACWSRDYQVKLAMEPNTNTAMNVLPKVLPHVDKSMGASVCASSSHGSSETCSGVRLESTDVLDKLESDVQSGNPAEIGDQCVQENMLVKIEVTGEKKEVSDKITAPSDDCASETKLGKTKVKGVSLIEWFTADQVREHLRHMKHSAVQGKTDAENTLELQYPVDENTCQLCGLSNLCFEPPAIYCAACSGRILRSRAYFTMRSTEIVVSEGTAQNYFCNQCYKGSHGESIKFAGVAILKAKLEKKRNDERVLEPWVQCDKCAGWQHQICSLFNDKQNEGEKAEYTCPKCYLHELEIGERIPLSSNVSLGAKGLPTSKLSEYIEKRLFSRLKQEREERAKKLGKHFNEVPGAENLVVRVVSSIDKKLEVKKPLLDIFKEENYPEEFLYKSKAILLFQNIEGADVFIYAMYVQEYGSNCPNPNQRRVYISYIDSVKYFYPEIETVTGEALRTFVYHQILIGYLGYCKKRGFTSCYIWSCPALKREDFIINCHPEKQKMPKQDKLREWYLAWLKKAAEENIVVHRTNLYDHFFFLPSECKSKSTAARLPYFDGDYWPGYAEEILNILQQTEEGKGPQKKQKISISRRALKPLQRGTPVGMSKDILLMHKLGEIIRPNKEDFILVHLQHACKHCCEMIVTGNRWVCNMCRDFQLCEKCHDVEQKLDEKSTHPINEREKHSFSPVEVNDVPADTADEDEVVQNEISDSRLAFLNFCQLGHYQYDTLRRAKHSTMMILYHLHNTVPPALGTLCITCPKWSCLSGDSSICDSRPLLEDGMCHVHKSVNRASIADHDEMKGMGTEQKAPQEPLATLVHAAECPGCGDINCRKMKSLFRHGTDCKIRSNGGCILCMTMWNIMVSHALTCRGPVCQVPRCSDLKKHYKKKKEMESQSDFRQRAAARERMGGKESNASS